MVLNRQKILYTLIKSLCLGSIILIKPICEYSFNQNKKIK